MDLKQLLGIPSLESLLGVGKNIVSKVGQALTPTETIHMDSGDVTRPATATFAKSAGMFVPNQALGQIQPGSDIKPFNIKEKLYSAGLLASQALPGAGKAVGEMSQGIRLGSELPGGNIIKKAADKLLNKKLGGTYLKPEEYSSIVKAGEKYPTDKAGNLILNEGKKYKTTINLQDKNDINYLKRIFSEDTVKDIINGKKQNWRGDSYEDIARVNFVSEKPKTVSQILQGKIKPIQLETDTFYHGTTRSNANKIIKEGFKTGKELPEDIYRGGGYGKIQSSISLSESPETASIFSSLTNDGKIIKTKLNKGSKVVTIDGVQDAIDLEDYIDYLKKQKIDAVYIGGGEKELVIINPKAIKITE